MSLRDVLRAATTFAACAAAAIGAAARPAAAQTVTAPAIHPIGRVSFYADAWRIAPDGTPATTLSEFITSVTFQLPDGEGNGIEYGVDSREAASTRPGAASRTSIYDGYAGVRLIDGRLRLRGGQMWLTDLGGLGAVTGGLVEYREAPTHGGFGRLRFGGFGGVEPDPYDVGFAPAVHKMGGYAAVDGGAGRRHVLGYVLVRNGALTERSVVTFTNFVPAAGSKIFVYQAGEYDVAGPAGQGHGGLSYLMINARASASSAIELQGLFHHGRSIDARGIADDIRSGQPIPAGALDGLLYESIGGRVTARLTRSLRVQAGYTRDRNNQDSTPTGRLLVGASLTNIAKTGLDLTVNESRITRPTGQYNSLYISGGRQVGRRVYLTLDYSSSVTIAHFTTIDGVTIETQPHTREFSGSAVVTLGRHVSLLVDLDHTRDDTVTESRVLAGLTYRIR